MLQHHKSQFILTLCLAFLLSIVSVAYADSPLQGGSDDGSSQGDSLHLGRSLLTILVIAD